ncbi:hypothetical protein U4E84_04045 [Halorubrum sp. AD140]|uniref:hypothetical protein n=1 Tax=Halorubrum sp. AD140 TaxID=3050073 RepID=UPI002ACC9704|nr:hypothetical protein [Halorubrum sp. AD140]MDZ5810522.1 hypothetical protein [Halorubrum sp. AD140]
MNTSKVGYLTLNENPWSNLLRRQVIDVISESNKLTDRDIIFISFLPFYEFVRNRQNISNLSKELKRSNIKFVPIPLPFPIPIYSIKEGWKNNWKYDWIRMSLVIIYTVPILIIVKHIYTIGTYHCRSYPISVSTLITKYIWKDIELIFDPRSDFPEENITRGDWSRTSWSYQMWKTFEKELCIHSDYVIAISDTYVRHFKKIYPDVNVKIIPNNVNTDDFSPDQVDTLSFRKEHNICESTTIICYSGSMSENLWNNPDEYGCAIEKLLQLELELKFLFLIPAKSNTLLQSTLENYDISDGDYLIKNPDFDQVPTMLSYADLGIYILDNNSIRIGTKFVEYCSVGLPTVVNQNVKGAAEIIRKHDLGAEISIEFNSTGKYCPDRELSNIHSDRIHDLISNKSEIAQNCQDFAEENFDTSVVAGKYVEIY